MKKLKQMSHKWLYGNANEMLQLEILVRCENLWASTSFLPIKTQSEDIKSFFQNIWKCSVNKTLCQHKIQVWIKETIFQAFSFSDHFFH